MYWSVANCKIGRWGESPSLRSRFWRGFTAESQVAVPDIIFTLVPRLLAVVLPVSFPPFDSDCRLMSPYLLVYFKIRD